MITEAIKSPAISEYSGFGCVKTLEDHFSMDHWVAKRVIDGVVNKKKTEKEIVKRASRQDVNDTEWPKIVENFCLTKPICREAPGESVSVSYGQRAEKFIRQFAVEEIFNFFMLKYPDFPYRLPKNLVPPSLCDVQRNVCPLHENVKRALKSFNRFMKKNKCKELALPLSTIDICLVMICHPNDPEASHNPLNCKTDCTKGICDNCGAEKWFEDLKRKIVKSLHDKYISNSRWIRHKGADGKKKQILMNETCKMKEFLENVE